MLAVTKAGVKILPLPAMVRCAVAAAFDDRSSNGLALNAKCGAICGANEVTTLLRTAGRVCCDLLQRNEPSLKEGSRELEKQLAQATKKLAAEEARHQSKVAELAAKLQRTEAALAGVLKRVSAMQKEAIFAECNRKGAKAVYALNDDLGDAFELIDALDCGGRIE